MLKRYNRGCGGLCSPLLQDGTFLVPLATKFELQLLHCTRVMYFMLNSTMYTHINSGATTTEEGFSGYDGSKQRSFSSLFFLSFYRMASPFSKPLNFAANSFSSTYVWFGSYARVSSKSFNPSFCVDGKHLFFVPWLICIGILISIRTCL